MAGRTPSSERVARAQAVRLGTALRQAREDRGWSRDKLGRETGLASNTIRAIERAGTCEPGFFTVAAIARALEIGLAELYTSPN